MSAPKLLHGVLGDAIPDLRRAVVMAERIVDGGLEMEALADDGDDLAIAGVAHALHRVANLYRLCRGQAGSADRAQGRKNSLSHEIRHHSRFHLAWVSAMRPIGSRLGSQSFRFAH